MSVYLSVCLSIMTLPSPYNNQYKSCGKHVKIHSWTTAIDGKPRHPPNARIYVDTLKVDAALPWQRHITRNQLPAISRNRIQPRDFQQT